MLIFTNTYPASLVRDIRCVRSLNGYRVTEVVLRFVPRYRVFQLALKTIRFWAKCHKIYSHTLGEHRLLLLLLLLSISRFTLLSIVHDVSLKNKFFVFRFFSIQTC